MKVDFLDNIFFIDVGSKSLSFGEGFRMRLTSLICFLSFSFVAQTKTDTLRLLFEINEVQSENNFKRIDSLVASLNGMIINVKINGYADFLNSNQYNQSLSQKRADAAKNYLAKKVQPAQIQSLVSKANGEKFSKDNQSPQGDPFQRRVDIIVTPFVIQQNNDNPIEPQKPKALPLENPKEIEDLSQGESLALDGLNFVPGRHIVVKEAIPVLNKLLKTMKANKNLKIEIQGHICCLIEGDDGMDMDTHEIKLSENRAKSVYNFLVNNGIDAKRLTYKGYGRTKPKVVPETTPEEEQMNRRVEIMVIEK